MKLTILEKFDKNKYLDYLTDHIDAVKKAYQILIDKGICKEDKILAQQIAEHDASKYNKEEFDAYGEYFYGNKQDVEHKDDLAFKYAWNFHQKQNRHHWQFWILKEDDSDGLEALDMPEDYIIEMMCDWMSFAINKKDITELFKWYEENKSKQLLSDKTRKSVEKYLDKIKAANIEL